MPRFGVIGLLLFLPRFAQAQPALQPLPTSLPCHFGVIGLRAEPATPDTLQVRGVVPGGPAARAGLRPGDLLLGGLPYRLHTREELSRFIQSKAPGDSVTLAVQRQGQYLLLTFALTDRRQLFSFMAEEQRPFPALDRPHLQGLKAYPGPLEKAARFLLGRHQALPGLDRLCEALASEDTSYGADCRLSVPRYALRHPLKAWEATKALGATGPQRDLDALLQGVAGDLDLELPTPELPSARAHPDSLLDQLAPFFCAGRLVETALAPLDTTQQRELRSQAPALLRYLAEHPSPDLADSTQDARLHHLLGMAKKVGLAQLFAASRELASLCTPARLQELAQSAVRQRPLAVSPLPGIRGQLLFARSSPWGWILVGGKGPNHYQGPVALVLDLGGDDTYDLPDPPPVSLCIDYRGDDRYLGPVGAAIAGVALSMDLQGRDEYRSGWLGQGAAFCGVGVLVDCHGHDRYRADEYAQGSAFFGAGILLEGKGDDQYAAAEHSQGFGSMRGLGLLRDDQGDDQYLADLQIPSSYGDAGLYEGWSQGVGCGVRGYGEGGMGLLVDQAGDDRYQGGNFSQGVGYFFGLGALLDQRGDDRYVGSRYAQGAAAHQAVGVLADLGGNDRYQSRVAAGQGSGWDAAVGLLIDQEGDDCYRAEDLSQGAGAMNGLGLLLDQKGNDTYQATSGQGASGSLEYWGGRDAPNLGVLMDWAGKDTYNLEGRKDRTEFSTPGLGLFEDR